MEPEICEIDLFILDKNRREMIRKKKLEHTFHLTLPNCKRTPRIHSTSTE